MRRGMGVGAAAAVAALVFAAALTTTPAAAQQVTPFQGRNTPLPGNTEVFVSAICDRLIEVDEYQYRFEAVLWMMFTWRDPRARPARDAGTAAAAQANSSGCEYPCTTLYAWTPGALCCDDVWLPHFELVNARGMSQDRVVRYGVRMQDDTDAVAWWAHVQGEFYTPMSFKAFPFDRQYLVVQLEYGDKFNYSNIIITPSATSLQLYQPQSGDDISGWTLQSVELQTFDLEQQNFLDEGGATNSAPGDPWPLHPANSSEPHFEGYLWNQGVNVILTVQRISIYYVISSVFVIACNTCLALLVFSVSPRHLDTRLGIVVTLFLSLTALQFIVASTLPSSSTVVPTQQLILASDCVLGIIAVVSIGVHRLTTYHRQRDRNRRLKHAQLAFANRWDSVHKSMTLDRAQQAPGAAPSAAELDGQQAGVDSDTMAPGRHRGVISPFAAAAAALGSVAPRRRRPPPEGDADGSAAPSSSEDEAYPAAPDEYAGAGSEARPAAASNGAAVGAATQPPSAPWWRRPDLWCRTQVQRFRAMCREVDRSPTYAMGVARAIDRGCFWFVLVTYFVVLICIFAIQSQMQTELLL